MPYGLPPHLYLADTGDGIILLDTISDRYFQLDGAPAEHLRYIAAGGAPAARPDMLEALLASGLLVDAPDARRVAGVEVAPAEASVLDGVGEAARIAPATCAAALLLARWQLSRLGFAAMVARLRAIAVMPSDAEREKASAVARGFGRARAWVPATRKCLPDSIALFMLLARRGLGARLVIGVRSQPFAAHAWVQHGSVILSDPVDSIAELIPILAL